MDEFQPARAVHRKGRPEKSFCDDALSMRLFCTGSFLLKDTVVAQNSWFERSVTNLWR
jgi:hypothetical protein